MITEFTYPVSVSPLLSAHRRIEADLDEMSRSLDQGALDLDAFQRAWALCRELYPEERDWIATVHEGAAHKIARQHDQALELAAAVEEAGEDRTALARRFVAIVQHTIIEVERDVFPLRRQNRT
jgi:hypothetical protein